MISRPLHRFALAACVFTFLLLGAGGLVTSHGVGMAVPDWPNTFGYNMFFFPVSQWVGGVFYEHTHRLLASGVGLLTTVLALWLHGRPARRFLRWTGVVLVCLALITTAAFPARGADALVLGMSGLAGFAASFFWPACPPAVAWLRKLGVIAFCSVLLQGVLGGLRVVLFKDQIGIFHATLAQLFFVLMCAIALVTSRWWQLRFGSVSSQGPLPSPRTISVSGPAFALSRICLCAAGLILVQLVLGATMRHQHAGLSIPDFPLAYGKLWPATDPESIARYNQQRIEVLAANPITAFQVILQMIHRLIAICILVAVAYSARLTRRTLGPRHMVARLSMVWLGLILLQAALGAATVWSNKAADVATLHVLVGALSLACASIISIVSLAEFKGNPRLVPASQLPESATFSPQPSPVVGFE